MSSNLSVEVLTKVEALAKEDGPGDQSGCSLFNEAPRPASCDVVSSHIPIVFEFAIFLCKKYCSNKTICINQLLSAQEVQLLEVETTIHQKAIPVFLKYLDHKLSFTDATTVVLYKERAMDEIFT